MDESQRIKHKTFFCRPTTDSITRDGRTPILQDQKNKNSMTGATSEEKHLISQCEPLTVNALH